MKYLATVSRILLGRVATLALVLLGAVFANILFFHLAMQIATISIPLVPLVLWAIVAYDRRASLAVLFTK
jgi:hypothetical protein